MKHMLSNITCNHRKKLIRPTLWNALASFANLFPFVCLASIVTQIYQYEQSGQLQPFALWSAWGVMIVFFVITYVLEHIACKVTFCEGFRVAAEGRVGLAEHIRKLPLGFLLSVDSGEIGNTMMNDFSKTETAMTHVLPQLISGILVAVISFAVMLFSDWRMAIAMFAGFPVAIAVMFGMQGLERKLNANQNAAKVEQASKMQEYLYGMKIIKSYNLQGDHFTKLKKACTGYRDASMKVESGIGPLNLLSGAILHCGLSLITIVGVPFLLGGTLTVSNLALFLLAGSRIFDPLAVAIMNYAELISGSMAGERIVKLFHQPVMSGDKKTGTSRDIQFQDVTFGYGEQTVLHHVTASVKSGQLTAIVGPSGSGKSTMLRLIARFYDPTEGQVLFGGSPEREMDPENLMKEISMVFQDVYLFQDTIAHNIGYGRESASRAEMEQAARLANCYDFIMSQPQGFETMIGEGGVTLSGGEKQRISIARAILKDAPIILLDEATSSLDPENEAEIQQAISRLVQGRTVVVIAHRLKTIIGADQILVLDQGHIVESGTHPQLLSQKGLYAKLWNLQTNGEGWTSNHRIDIDIT